MNVKRILSGLLAGATLCGLLVAAPASAAKLSVFTDVTDPATASAAETLRLLGVVSGDEKGNFNPFSPLTRAQFCKMAVEVMGNGDKVMAQMNRTVFQDVPSTHWARGYVAVATQGSSSGSGEDKVSTPGIIRGDATGLFHPDRAITYAEAVTILMRVLGYQDADLGIGSSWYDGYLSTAQSIDLTEGVTLRADADLTRGQAALLFDNLLFTEKKGSKELYLTTLECKISDEAIIFAVDATAPDGSSNAVKAGEKVYKTSHAPFSDDLVGRRAKLVLDRDERVIATQVSESGTQRVVSVLSATYSALKLSDGTEVKIDDAVKVKVYQNNKETTYDKAYLNMGSGAQAVLQYSAGGELEYLFLRASSRTDSATTVLKNKPSASATEPVYKIYKNGVPATTKDYRQYDVTTFDGVNNVMYVSDLRITGVYENVYPNPQTPAKVTIMGKEFDVLSSAYADLATFKPGENITLLLSHSGMVAGAVAPSVAKSTTVGQVKSIDQSSGEAQITTINLRDAAGQPVVLSGKTSYTGVRATEMTGQLVTVSSSQKGSLNLSKLSGAGAVSPLSLDTGKIGSAALAANVRMYEQVGNSAMAEIEREDLTVATVPAAKIPYVHKDYAGNIDIIVFNDATGDRYDYGFFLYTAPKVVEPETNNPMSGSTSPATLAVTNALKPNGTTAFSFASSVRSGVAGGVVGALDLNTEGNPKLSAFVELQAVKNVASASFDTTNQTVTTSSAIYPIADNVQCYNRITKTWFTLPASPTDDDYMAALDMARAYSATLTVYIDKAPEDGGKVRLVVVE